MPGSFAGIGEAGVAGSKGQNDIDRAKGHTVDGRNPAPPGMYKTLQIVG